MRYGMANQGPFLNTTLQTEVMVRLKLLNMFLKNRAQANETVYKRERNHYIIPGGKEKLLSKPGYQRVTDNMQFYKTIKPCFWNNLKNYDRKHL